MQQKRPQYSITRMCKWLEVSRAGYYKWLNGESRRRAKHVALLKRILEIFEESRETYGCPRVYEQLRSEGWKCNYKLVERLMSEHQISPTPKRKFKTTTDSNHDLPIAPNLLDQDFVTQEPDEVWVSDITYIPTTQGWLFLCVFIDLYTRSVVGWSMSATMKAEIVVDAFRMGLERRGRAPVVAHSDRGSQYASALFREELERADTLQSMSRKGNCWDNAVAESFFGIIKSELIYRHNWMSRIAAMTAIFDYIECFYNKKRSHSALSYATPEEKGLKGKKAA
jgi:putative transposase